MTFYWLTHIAGTATDDRSDCFNARPVQEKSRCNVQSLCVGRTQVSPCVILSVLFRKYQTNNNVYSLSKRKLVAWLKLILRNQTVVETLYQPWSYTVTTGTKRSPQVSQMYSNVMFSCYFQDSTMHSSCLTGSPCMCLTCRSTWPSNSSSRWRRPSRF